MAEVLAGAPDEVVTNAVVQMVSLTPFGHTGRLSQMQLYKWFHLPHLAIPVI